MPKRPILKGERGVYSECCRTCCFVFVHCDREKREEKKETTQKENENQGERKMHMCIVTENEAIIKGMCVV